MNRHSGKKGSPLRSQWWQKPSPLSAEEKATWIWGPAGFLPRSMAGWALYQSADPRIYNEEQNDQGAEPRRACPASLQ